MNTKDFIEHLAIFAFLTPFVIPIIYGIICGIKCISREISYKLNGKSQRLMFNQLKGGDFIWVINDNELHYRFVKNVEYIFAKNEVRYIKIIFYGAYPCLELSPEKAKSYRCGNYYTLMDEANAEVNYIRLKREKSINSVKNATAEDVVKAASVVVEHLNTIVNNIKNNK
jgi:hypothetical protein